MSSKNCRWRHQRQVHKLQNTFCCFLNGFIFSKRFSKLFFAVEIHCSRCLVFTLKSCAVHKTYCKRNAFNNPHIPCIRKIHVQPGPASQSPIPVYTVAWNWFPLHVLDRSGIPSYRVSGWLACQSFCIKHLVQLDAWLLFRPEDGVLTQLFEIYNCRGFRDRFTSSQVVWIGISFT